MNKEERNTFRKEIIGKLEEQWARIIALKTTSSIITLQKIKSSFPMPYSG